jgi:hypothetical protein
MANTTRQRLRRAAKAAGLQGRLLTGTRRVRRRDPWAYGPYPPDPPSEGGAGVREPRRTGPQAPGGALELELAPEPQHLDLRASGPLS